MEEFEPENFEVTDKNSTDDEDDEFETVPANKFDRSSNGGAFRMESWAPKTGDVIPPGDITDLKVLAIETGDKQRVTLQFTTPGDDLDVGNVSSLELRASMNSEELITNFESGILLNDTNIVNGSLEPMGPGEKVAIMIELPEELSFSEPKTIYFAMRAKDESGKNSSRYNIASATFGIKLKPTRGIKVHKDSNLADDEDEDVASKGKKKTKEDEKSHEKNMPSKDEVMKGHVSDTAKLDEDNMDDQGKNSKWWPVIVGIGVAFTVIMIVLLIAVVIIKRSKKRTYTSVQNQQC
ncbi:Calcium-activated chloride channel regulator like protein [Argiope bruennichi]|uniref:Calcium-activated chloride channel regulator like protein n=2 Tax=Argiope bruennichi TaxID=94029 RepID=A0A8T0FJD4_ARGBR|nr:Calcium-activated chloride channel regulator like protein [Argiope bruennichi]